MLEKVLPCEPEDVTMRFSPEAAKDIKRKKWHPKQRIKENPDGSIDLIVEVAGYEEIMRWVLAWGRKVEVIAPEQLRKMVLEEAKSLLKRYR